MTQPKENTHPIKRVGVCNALGIGRGLHGVVDVQWQCWSEPCHRTMRAYETDRHSHGPIKRWDTSPAASAASRRGSKLSANDVRYSLTQLSVSFISSQTERRLPAALRAQRHSFPARYRGNHKMRGSVSAEYRRRIRFCPMRAAPRHGRQQAL